MKKKEYEKPSLKVFKLEQKANLLVDSLKGKRNNPYGAPITY